VFWALHYFLPVGDLTQKISYRADDATWVPSGFKLQNLVGSHFFGDFQLFYAWGSATNPYVSEYPSQLLPSGNYIFTALSFLPIQIALVALIASSIATLFLGIYKLASLFGGVDPYQLVRTFVITCLFSLPVLVDFDRGNTQTLTMGALALFFAYGFSGNISRALLALALAISLKPYLALFTLAFVNRQNFRQHAFFIGIYASANFMLFMLLPGGLPKSILGWWQGMTRYSGLEGIGYMAHSGSIIGAISRWMEMLFGTQRSLVWLEDNLILISLISALMVILGLSIWYRKQYPIWLRLLGAFSITTLAQPGSLMYQWIWVAIVSVVFFYETRHTPFSRERIFNLVAIQILCATALVPTWIAVSGPSGTARPHSTYLILSPMLLLYLGYKLSTRVQEKVINIDSLSASRDFNGPQRERR